LNKRITTKEAKTKLLANDGDTVVIGGLKKIRFRKEESGTPFLSEVPLLGRLFKAAYEDNKDEELLIFITSKII
jgi:type IV pilus assembly protein PilQ